MKKKMLTTATIINVPSADIELLNDIPGVSVDAIPLGQGYYNIKLGYTPAQLTQESKDLLVDFIRDSIFSYHQ